MGYMTTPSVQSPVVTHPDLTKQYEGIGGWLILLAIGLVLTPLRIVILFARDFFPLFSSGAWSALTTPGTRAYHELWGPLIMMEVLVNSLLIVWSLVLIRLLFSKRRSFPGWMIAFYCGNLFFVSADAAASELIPQLAAIQDSGSVKEIARSAVACLIWIPYLLVSKRVKATFVEQG